MTIASDRRTRHAWVTRAFLARGFAVAFLAGMLVGVLLALGGGTARAFNPANLFWSGLVGTLIFAVSIALIAGTERLTESLGPAGSFAVRATIFLVAGMVGWGIVHELVAVVQGEAGLPSMSLRQLALPLAVTGALALLVGFGFQGYERLRDQLSTSVSRLKEAEFAERELVIARAIQARLLPPAEVVGQGYRVACRNLPARFVAGDFYDVFALPDGGLGLAVADVSGKGIGTGLIMASVKAVLPLLAAADTVEGTLGKLNRKLVAELEPRQFVALCLARFDPASGELTLANAGLPDPYLLRPGAAPEALTVPGPRLPLGLREDQRYQALRLRLAPADRLLLLTDGLPEAQADGAPLGYDALTGLFPAAGPPPGPWLDALLAAVHAATGPDLDDDWTALLLERPGAA